MVPEMTRALEATYAATREALRAFPRMMCSFPLHSGRRSSPTHCFPRQRVFEDVSQRVLRLVATGSGDLRLRVSAGFGPAFPDDGRDCVEFRPDGAAKH